MAGRAEVDARDTSIGTSLCRAGRLWPFLALGPFVLPTTRLRGAKEVTPAHRRRGRRWCQGGRGPAKKLYGPCDFTWNLEITGPTNRLAVPAREVTWTSPGDSSPDANGQDRG